MKIFAGALILSGAMMVATAADSLVGEWATSLEMCGKTRLVWTAGGQHEAWMFDNGDWSKLDSTGYRRDGDFVVYDKMENGDQGEVISVDQEKLVYRSVDKERMKAIGPDRIELVRCPLR